MTDIVETIRLWAKDYDAPVPPAIPTEHALQAAEEIEYLRTLITAWCDAMDAEWDASYDELQKAVLDRNHAEKYLRAAVGR